METRGDGGFEERETGGKENQHLMESFCVSVSHA